MLPPSPAARWKGRESGRGRENLRIGGEGFVSKGPEGEWRYLAGGESWQRSTRAVVEARVGGLVFTRKGWRTN